MNALPKATEPLVLADGTKIDPTSGRVIRDDVQIVEIPTESEARRIVTQTRRTVADLPAVPQTMNPINIVLCYDLFGMDDQHIAVATGLTIEQVTAIKTHDAYGQMRKTVAENVTRASEDEVTSILTVGRINAARKVTSLVGDNDPDIALKAANLVFQHSKKVDAAELTEGLEIKVVRKNAQDQMPNIVINL